MHFQKMSTKTFNAWKNTKFFICQNPKKPRIQSKQRNGGTRNKHCNLLIYTVPLNRVLIERRYYNIQTIKYHNWFDIFTIHFQKMSTKTFDAWKNTKFFICRNPKNTKYRIQSKQRNGGTRNKQLNLLIYTVPLNRVRIERCCYNIQPIK